MSQALSVSCRVLGNASFRYVFFLVPSSTPTVQPTERTTKTISTEKVSSTGVKTPVGTPRKYVARPRKGNINVRVAINFFYSVEFCFSLVFCYGNEFETKKKQNLTEIENYLRHM